MNNWVLEILNFWFTINFTSIKYFFPGKWCTKIVFTVGHTFFIPFGLLVLLKFYTDLLFFTSWLHFSVEMFFKHTGSFLCIAFLMIVCCPSITVHSLGMEEATLGLLNSYTDKLTLYIFSSCCLLIIHLKSFILNI